MGAVAAGPLGQARTAELATASVNAVPRLLSKVVALLVADGHHPYLSWVASSTRAP